LHKRHQDSPYLFSRKYRKDKYSDQVLVMLDGPAGSKTIPVFDLFANGATLLDSYSGQTAKVRGGQIVLDTPYSTVLLAETR
jgi:alpha-amylase